MEMTIHDDFPPVADCQCGRCRAACQLSPGWFLPSEIAPLAAAMELSVEELFARHLMVNWWAADSLLPLTFVLAPAIRESRPGREYPGDPRGRCRWYRGGRCQIHERGKPFECARAHHDGTEAHERALHLAVARAWSEHQGMIGALLGREPQATPLPRTRHF